VRALVAAAEKEGEGTLRFRYVLDADLNRVRVPAAHTPRQADELWKHTCFEAFIACAAPVRSDEYLELNFSPSTEWAVYSFESYRKGMTRVGLTSRPRVEVTRATSQLVLEARVDMQGLLPQGWRASGAKLRVALSAVIEDESGPSRTGR